jgi:hypothetical protein
MVDWTKEAIDAANKLLNREWSAGIPDDLMRAALDAAVKAYGEQKPDVVTLKRFNATYNEGYIDGRAEALEEAALRLEHFAQQHPKPIGPTLMKASEIVRSFKLGRDLREAMGEDLARGR